MSKHWAGGGRAVGGRKCRYMKAKKEDKREMEQRNQGKQTHQGRTSDSIPKKACMTNETSLSPSSLLRRRKAVIIKVLPIYNTGMPQQNMDSLGSLTVVPVASP